MTARGTTGSVPSFCPGHPGESRVSHLICRISTGAFLATLSPAAYWGKIVKDLNVKVD
jgi:hypothetical protein